MNLEEFKASLESDATRRCKAQQKTISELIAHQKADAERIRCLENRCWTFSGNGGLCQFCGYITSCKTYDQNAVKY